MNTHFKTPQPATIGRSSSSNRTRCTARVPKAILSAAMATTACGGTEPVDDFKALERPAHVDLSSGRDDPPGAGKVFVLDTLQIADERGGFDVDGRCSPDGCVDNALSSLAWVNDQLRQSLLGGESITLVELAGIDEPFYGDDSSVTLKLYGARDFDDPFFPANNFRTPMGETECCQFVALAPWRSETEAWAVIEGRFEDGWFRGTSPELLVAPAPFGSPTPAKRVQVAARLSASMDRLEELVLGGALPIANLEPVECDESDGNCRMISALQSYVARWSRPDVDLDGDGLEVVTVDETSTTVRCFDGCGTEVCTDHPIESETPGQCVRDPHMADGYSFAYRATGVPAELMP